MNDIASCASGCSSPIGGEVRLFAHSRSAMKVQNPKMKITSVRRKGMRSGVPSGTGAAIGRDSCGCSAADSGNTDGELAARSTARDLLDVLGEGAWRIVARNADSQNSCFEVHRWLT